MTEAENLISKGSRAATYTKGEWKKWKIPTQQRRAQWKPEEKVSTNQLSDLSEGRQGHGLLPEERQAERTHFLLFSRPYKSNTLRSHVHLRMHNSNDSPFYLVIINFSLGIPCKRWGKSQLVYLLHSNKIMTSWIFPHILLPRDMAMNSSPSLNS